MHFRVVENHVEMRMTGIWVYMDLRHDAGTRGGPLEPHFFSIAVVGALFPSAPCPCRKLSRNSIQSRNVVFFARLEGMIHAEARVGIRVRALQTSLFRRGFSVGPVIVGFFPDHFIDTVSVSGFEELGRCGTGINVTEGQFGWPCWRTRQNMAVGVRGDRFCRGSFYCRRTGEL
jgi:hypothetical protein